MEKIYLILILLFSTVGFSQTDFLSPPKNNGIGFTPDWTAPIYRSPVDSCGTYYNNYVGLVKATDIYFEGMRTGNGADFNPYAGRAQRFHANQPIEVSGIQFYAFQTNALVDSIMTVTILFDYDEVLDSVGVELARDTVWVTHSVFTPLLPDLEVNSVFDEPVLITDDYIIGVYTSTNDSLKIITDSALDGDGDGEGVSFAYYNNPVAPSFTGWYATLPYFGPSYDIDYLINPLVNFDLHDEFVMDNDSICPSILSAVCTDYTQVPNFADLHYNAYHATPTDRIMWNWGDGLQNAELTSLCHTYSESGTYTITLIDTLRRHHYSDPTCALEITKTIVVLDSAVANATHTATGLTAIFNGTATLSDSVAWNFGDGTEWSTEEDPTHIYTGIGDYDVWFYAYGPCNTDSVLVEVNISDASIDQNKQEITIYPNPANTEIYLKGLAVDTEIEILTILSEIVYQSKTTELTTIISTSHLSNGTYIVKLQNANTIRTNKLIIKH